MKHLTLVLTLLTIFSLSFISSCSSCQSSTTANNTCDGGDCSSPTPTSSSYGSGQGAASTGNEVELEDNSNNTSICLPEANLTCTDTNTTSNKVNVIKEDGWQITLPVEFEKRSSSKKEVVLSAYSDKNKVLLVVMKENFTGKFEEYVLTNVRNIRGTGAKILSTKTVDSEGKTFILIESMKNDIKIWSLASTKNGFGYGVSCGGPEPYDAVNTICTSITDTFTLN